LRIEFSSNADDAAEVSALWHLQSTAGKALKQRTILSCGIGAAVASAYLLFRNGNSWMFVLLVGVGVGVAAGGAYASVYDALLNRRVRRYIRETIGTAAFPFIAELREPGLWFRMRDMEALWNWSALREIKETERGVELWFETGIVIARVRAFPTLDEQRIFVRRARELAGR
jgi:hypothetical protein